MNRLIKYLAALAVLGGLAWYGARRAGWGRSEKVDYVAEDVKIGDIRKTVRATGEVAAVQLVSVGVQVSGQIRKLHVVLGQEVRKGDLIAEIDSTTQENDLKINQARLKTYQAQLKSREIDEKIARLQYERARTLRGLDAASEESLENAENALASAAAQVEETRSLVEQTRISVSTAETNLGYARIAAPLDGTVVSVLVEEGQTVNANQTTPNLVQIADLSRMEVKMQISEGDVTRIKPGMPVVSTILSEPDRRFRGTLATIDPGLTTLATGAYNGAADTSGAIYYYGKFIVPNPEGALRIGMTTQNTIAIAEARGVLIVPSIAIRHARNQNFVRVLGDGQTTEEREVAVGLSDDLNTEILDGLKEGERVVTAQMTAAEIDASIGSGPGRRGPAMRIR